MHRAHGLIAVALLSTAHAQVQPSEREQAMARAYAAELRRHSVPLDIPEVSHWLERVGARIASGLRPGSPWSFELTADRSAKEPVSAPGGVVFVPAGAILAATDERAFVDALAHQMAHTANPNSLRPVKPLEASIPLVFMGGWLGHGHGVLVPKSLTAHAEQLEREADAIAAEALSKAGDVITGEFPKIQELVRDRTKTHRRPPTLHRK